MVPPVLNPGFQPPSVRQAEGGECNSYLNLITPNSPLMLSWGPAVKKSWLVWPLAGVPPPNSIPQSWLMVMGLPKELSIVPTKAPVVRLKPLMVPVLVLLLISRVLLSGPKFEGATANPQGWLRGAPEMRVFTKAPFS